MGEEAYSLIENLGLCEGNCNENCAEGLVCITPENESVRGCSGTARSDYKYCTYPALEYLSNQNDVNLDYQESFLRVTDDGNVKIYGAQSDLSSADSQYLVWDSQSGHVSVPSAESLDFEHGSDLSR